LESAPALHAKRQPEFNGIYIMMSRLIAAGVAMAGRAVVVAAVAFASPAPAPGQEPLMLPPAPAAAQTTEPADRAAKLESLETTLREIEGGFKDSAQSEEALVALKERLAPLRDQLSERLGRLEPRVKAMDERAAHLGEPPPESAAEDPAVTAERQHLATQRADLETALHRTRLLADRAQNIEERIRHRRREVFNSRLFARTASLLDAAFWKDLGSSIPAEVSGIAVMLSGWGAYARANGGIGGAVAALAPLSLIGIAASLMTGWRRRLSALPTPRRFDKALAATVSMAMATVKAPGLIAAAVLVLGNFRLMSDSASEIGFGLAVAAMVAGFGRGVAVGLFAPGQPDRRIIELPEQQAASLASHLIWASRFSGLSVFANEVHRILGASVVPFVATSELLSLAILAVTVHLLWRATRAGFVADQDGDETANTWRAWLRGLTWLFVIAIAAAVAAGYVGFAVFVATRMLALFAGGGAVIIILTAIDALLTDLLAAGTPGGRRLGAAFALTSRGVDLIGTLASALLRLVVIAFAVVLGLNFSGVFTDDIYSAMRSAASDYDVGHLHISPLAILATLACLVVGGLAVRAAQRWLAVNFLPRTGLDAGLQNSIVSLSGYFALIVVMTAGLGILGIDLQKIALIAGALSVGIGFGLQSVVSNFISGLILLAERSIRVGDWVVVKNEEGFVRRISIRSTEIETFDRASVIIPNQDFITGLVKNWTHSNTVGRIIVKVRVTYDSDVTRVRELLLEAAVNHPQVLPGTPAVYVMGFGDIGIDFELICLIGNLSQGMTVRSDLYIDILGKFRDVRIRIPAPPHEANVPSMPMASLPASKIA
jgi:potassium efflux system protein